MKSNTKKTAQLGMPIGTASAKLRKSILFSILKKFSLNYCYQCSAEIAKEEELSIEHKIPYLDSENPVKLFFDLENIALHGLIFYHVPNVTQNNMKICNFYKWISE